MTIPDVSAFARALRSQVQADGEGHQTWLNRVARAAGFRNYQHLSAIRKDAEPPADRARVTRALRWFDDRGRLARWPSRRGVRGLCLWAVWARVPPATEWDEREISALIDGMTTLKDAAQIRRSLFELGLLARNRDGTGYRRIERRPPPEARALIAELGAKAAA
jgi:hypothetical protein